MPTNIITTIEEVEIDDHPTQFGAKQIKIVLRYEGTTDLDITQGHDLTIEVPSQAPPPEHKKDDKKPGKTDNGDGADQNED